MWSTTVDQNLEIKEIHDLILNGLNLRTEKAMWKSYCKDGLNYTLNLQF